jgi:uncharacterized membrane protein YebE (DUF533 family)
MNRQETSFAWLGKETFGVPTEMTMSISAEENLAYAKALVVCAKGDGEITPDEREWLIGYSVTQGHPQEVVDAIRTYEGGDPIEDLLSASPNMPAYRRFLVYDALRACASDGDLAAQERQRVVAMAELMGVPADVVDDLEQIVQEHQALRQRLFGVLMADMSLT